MEKSASVTQTINLIIIITFVIYAHFLLSAFFHPHPASTGTPAVLVLQTPCLEPVKHASCTGFVAKSRTSLCFLRIPFRSLKQPDLWQDRFDSWAVKRVMSLFNSFCSNVVKKVARFCCPFYRTQDAEKTREKPTQRIRPVTRGGARGAFAPPPPHRPQRSAF